MRVLFGTTIAMLLAMHAALLGAQPYPNRPLRIIVPFPPGGGVDLNNRILTSRLHEFLGQQIVIDNRSGAGGNVGAALAAKATPDGYTLFGCGVASHGVSPAIYRKLPFDPERDLVGVALIGSTPNVLVVHPAVPAKSVAEYVAWAKAGGGKINYASPGVGTSPHMTMELFKMQSGVNMNHVAYKGGAPALQEIMGGHVPSMFGNLGEQIGAIRSGKTRALAVSSLKRNPALPDVPTVAESGFPGFEVTSWYASCAPAGVPAAILDQLNAAIAKVLELPDIRERYQQIATDVHVMSRAELAAWIRNEIEKWRKVAKSANVYVD
jgi:tripartite-type tricarboxylate transporter receptor subunit TctC